MVTGQEAVRCRSHRPVALVVMVVLAALAPSACGGGGTTPSSPSVTPSGSASGGVIERGQLVWKSKTRGWIASAPAVSGGAVYCAADSTLYALDAETGERLWKFDQHGGRLSGTPAVAHGLVYTCGIDAAMVGVVHALDVKSGKQRWVVRLLDGFFTSPAVAGGRVYVAGVSRLYALDGGTGREIWTAKARGGGQRVRAGAAASGRMVVFGTHPLEARDAATGKKLWAFLPWGQGSIATPVISHGWVYGRTSGFVDAVWAVDAQSVRWNKDSGNWSRPAEGPNTSPAVSGGVMYFTGASNTGGDGWLHACDAQSGDVIWVSSTTGDDDIAPAASDKVVCFVGGGKTLYALDAKTGREKWQFETSDSIVTSPVISNALVFVGGGDGYLYAVKQ